MGDHEIDINSGMALGQAIAWLQERFSRRQIAVLMAAVDPSDPHPFPDSESVPAPDGFNHWRLIAAVARADGLDVSDDPCIDCATWLFPTRRRMIDALGMREPDAPEWLQPGKLVFSQYIGIRGGNILVTTIEDGYVYFDRDRGRRGIPVGFAIGSYGPARADADRILPRAAA